MWIIFIFLLGGVFFIFMSKVFKKDTIALGYAGIALACIIAFFAFIIWVSEPDEEKQLQTRRESILYKIENGPIDYKLLADIEDFNNSINFNRKMKSNPFVGFLASGAAMRVDPIIFEYELEIKCAN